MQRKPLLNNSNRVTFKSKFSLSLLPVLCQPAFKLCISQKARKGAEMAPLFILSLSSKNFICVHSNLALQCIFLAHPLTTYPFPAKLATHPGAEVLSLVGLALPL